MDRLRLRLVADRAGEAHGLGRDLLGLAEGTGEHPLLGEEGEDPCPLHGRPRRGDVGGPTQRRGRTWRVSGGEPIAAEPCLEDRVLQPVLALTEGRERTLGVDDGTRRPARGSSCLRGELRHHGDRLRLEPGRDLRVGLDGEGDPHRRRQLEAELEGVQRIEWRLHREREPSGVQRRFACLCMPVRRPPVIGRDDGHIREPAGECRPVSRSLGRKEVRDDGPRDELVANSQVLSVLFPHEPVLDGLREARGEVRVEAVRPAPGQRGGARRERRRWRARPRTQPR